ncbi:hypothetical protein SALBM311S_12577 [Streptomyces alboniger]
MTEVQPTTAASAALWERDAEVDSVVRAVRDLRADSASSGSLLVIRGEAGFGKTALLTETRRIAERLGCTVWSARGGETLRSVPFNVVRQLLQPALVSLMPEEIRAYLGDWYEIAGPALGLTEPGERQADPQNVTSGGHLALAHAYVGLGHRRRGRLREAEASLRESLRIAERVGRGLPLYWSATCNLVDTLLARGHVDEAWSIAEQYGFAPPYPSTIVLPDPRSVRGRLLLAVGRTKDGVNELEAAEKAAAARGHHNPVLVPWAVDLARALAVQDPGRAARLATEARRHAERFGTDTAIGEALRCAAALETGQRAVRLAGQAVTYLEASPCQYEHAAARVEYGILSRSVTELNRGLALARSCGADGLADRASAALEAVRGPG